MYLSAICGLNKMSQHNLIYDFWMALAKRLIPITYDTLIRDLITNSVFIFKKNINPAVIVAL